MELCLSSFSGAVSVYCRFFATSSFKDFNGYGTLFWAHFRELCPIAVDFSRHLRSKTSMAMELCRSSFSGAVSDCCRFFATSSFKDFNGYGTLSELVFGSCDIFRDIFEQKLQWLWNSVGAHFRELCLTAVDFPRHLRSKYFNGYGTLFELIFGSFV